MLECSLGSWRLGYKMTGVEVKRPGKGSTCNNTSERNSGNVVGGKLNLMWVILGEGMWGIGNLLMLDKREKLVSGLVPLNFWLRQQCIQKWLLRQGRKEDNWTLENASDTMKKKVELKIVYYLLSFKNMCNMHRKALMKTRTNIIVNGKIVQ